MFVLEARNVHTVFPKALQLLAQNGNQSKSRNGTVIRTTMPVTTIYERPWERVLFWPERDANPFFHLYESLWMLSGRNDLKPLLRYVKTFGSFSDNGETLRGAYGHRWRRHFDTDQLRDIAGRLASNLDDRRSVLAMWDPRTDLRDHDQLKDIPCNLTATFQRHPISGALEMTVFNRSNDIIWGAYGANAVHFAFLQEYLAAWIGCAPGRYYQVSTNWHAYTSVLDSVRGVLRVLDHVYSVPVQIPDPYREETVKVFPMFTPGMNITQLDADIHWILDEADNGFPGTYPRSMVTPFARNVEIILRAHHLYSMHSAPTRFDVALDVLQDADEDMDWVVAAFEWVERRRARWAAK